MPQIRVVTQAGLFHLASGFKAWAPGLYEFSDDPLHRPWLDGQIARGHCRIVADGDPDAEGVDLNTLGMDALKALAKVKKIPYRVGMSKADLIAALSAAE